MKNSYELLRLVFLFWGVLLGGALLQAQWVPLREQPLRLPSGEPFAGDLLPRLVDQNNFVWFTAEYDVAVYDGEQLTRFDQDDGRLRGTTSLAQDGAGYIWVQTLSSNGQPGKLLRSSVPVREDTPPETVRFTPAVGDVPLLSGGTSYDVWSGPRGNIWGYNSEHLVRYNISDGGVTADTLFSSPRIYVTTGLSFHGDSVTLFTPNIAYRMANDYRFGDALDSIPLPSPFHHRNYVDERGGIWYLETAALMYSPSWAALKGGERTKIKDLYNPYHIVKPHGESEILVMEFNGTVNRYRITDQALLGEYTFSEITTSISGCRMVQDSSGMFWFSGPGKAHTLAPNFTAFGGVEFTEMPAAIAPEERPEVMCVVYGGPTGDWVMAGTTEGLFVLPDGQDEWEGIVGEAGDPLINVQNITQDGYGAVWWVGASRFLFRLSAPGSAPALAGVVRRVPVEIAGRRYVVEQVESNGAYRVQSLPLPGGDTPEGSVIWSGEQRLLQVTWGSEPPLVMGEDGHYSGGRVNYFAQDEEDHLIVGSASRSLQRSVIPLNATTLADLHARATPFVQTGVIVPDTLFAEVPLRLDTTSFDYVRALVRQGDSLWIAVRGGLLVTDRRPELNAGRFIPIPGTTYFPHFSSDGERLWVTTSNGLIELDRASGSILKHLTTADGLLGNKSQNTESLAETAAGRLYHVTNRGLGTLDPAAVRSADDDASVHLREFAYTEDGWGKNELAVRYAGRWARYEPLLYETRLFPYEEEWSEPSRRTTARFTNLPAFAFSRAYDFQVRVAGAEKFDSHTFRVASPVYLRWWALLLYLGLAALAVSQLLRFRLRQQRTRLALEEAELIRWQRDQIQEKNDQNELLLQEIHHRVKNNLQVVSSLLGLQSNALESEKAKAAISTSRSRIDSIGLLHKNLYRGDNLTSIRMPQYFAELTANLQDASVAGERTRIVQQVDDIELDVDTAVPLGLIANELITNALKYAFPEGRAGTITVRLRALTQESYRLTVMDDGIGYGGPSAREDAVSGGFGTRLVQLLTRQLRGKLSRSAGPGGVKVSVAFRLAVHAPSPDRVGNG